MKRAASLLRHFTSHVQCQATGPVRCVSSSSLCPQLAQQTFDLPDIDPPEGIEEVPSNRYEIEVLEAEHRAKGGKNPNKHCRKAGRVPAILFSLPGETSRLVSLDKKRVDRLIGVHGRSGLASRIFLLQLRDEGDDEDTYYPVIAKSIHRTGTTEEIENISFMYAPPARIIKVDVPIKVAGEDVSPGIKRGGFVHVIRRQVSCLCLGDRVPTHFEVDVSKLQLGEKLGLESLDNLPPGIVINEKHILDPICRIAGRASRE